MTKLITAFLILSALVCAQPVIQQGSTVNGADYSADIAPGTIIVVFGLNLAPEYFPALTVPLPTELGGTSVEFGDGETMVALPLYNVLPNQVAAQVPYDAVVGNSYKIRVRTPAGVSIEDTIIIVEKAPKWFTINQEGFGRVVGIDIESNILLRSNPMIPGERYVLYANSMGQTDPPAATGSGAGDGAGGGPLNVVTDNVRVIINEREARVDWVGLVPYLVGLHQINIFSPYNEMVGDVGARLVQDGVQSQPEMTLPVEPNGFYYIYSGGKFPNGQVRNGAPGPNSSIAFRHEDPAVWEETGFREWTLNTTMQDYHDESSGLALTLMNGDEIVYDNNGIEDQTFGSYYDNFGADTDANKAGIWEWYSNVNDDYAIFATYFKLLEETTFDAIIGYFDDNGRPELRFNPASVYNTYRMNIWSMGTNGVPAVNDVIGDVFTSDEAAGAFEYSVTTAVRVFANGARDPIYRMVYTLEEPVTLQPGEYWFAHDLMVPKPLHNPEYGEPGVTDVPRSRKASSGRAYKPVPPDAAGIGQ
jgi:uncharacterized protein (TIGR03437 family)